jgi:hypothetical protein
MKGYWRRGKVECLLNDHFYDEKGDGRGIGNLKNILK